MRTFIAAILLCLLATAVQAADVTGQWQAQIPGRDGSPMETTFKFKVSGGQVTGTVENQYGEREISAGKTSGDDISFTVNIDAGGNQMTFLYNGKVSGNEIKFTRERKGGEFGPAKVEFVAKRKS
jgi:opacity protein-like surface antigen